MGALNTRDVHRRISLQYSTQKANPLRNYWCLQVQSDMEELKLEMTDLELRALSKEKVKEKVKTACREAAFLFLKTEKEKVVRKLGKINYPQLCMQSYLQTNDMNNRLKKFAFRARMRMLKVSKNYGLNQYCPLCKDDDVNGQIIDSQEHLMECIKIKEHVPEIRENVAVKHDDIYGENSGEIKRATELLHLAMKMRTQLLSRTRESQVCPE